MCQSYMSRRSIVASKIELNNEEPFVMSTGRRWSVWTQASKMNAAHQIRRECTNPLLYIIWICIKNSCLWIVDQNFNNKSRTCMIQSRIRQFDYSTMSRIHAHCLNRILLLCRDFGWRVADPYPKVNCEAKMLERRKKIWWE